MLRDTRKARSTVALLLKQEEAAKENEDIPKPLPKVKVAKVADDKSQTVLNGPGLPLCPVLRKLDKLSRVRPTRFTRVKALVHQRRQRNAPTIADLAESLRIRDPNFVEEYLAEIREEIRGERPEEPQS